MLSLQKLKIFVLVSDRGSFNKAATDLMMSQSGVSQHIRDLEISLGADLFVRSPRGVAKTAAGDMLYGYAQHILQLVAQAQHEIKALEQPEEYKLTLGTTPGVSVYFLPQWLGEFQKHYRTLQVSLDAVKTHEIVDGVLTDKYDLGFLEGELQELDRSDLAQLNIFDMHYHVMVGANHAWAERQTVTLTDLSEQPFVNRQADSRTRQWLEATLSQHDIQLNNAAEFDSPGTVKYALLSGMGVGILPDYAVRREVERGEIHILHLEKLTLKRPLKIVWAKHKPLNIIQESFVDLIQALKSTHEIPIQAIRTGSS